MSSLSRLHGDPNATSTLFSTSSLISQIEAPPQPAMSTEELSVHEKAPFEKLSQFQKMLMENHTQQIEKGLPSSHFEQLPAPNYPDGFVKEFKIAVNEGNRELVKQKLKTLFPDADDEDLGRITEKVCRWQFEVQHYVEENNIPMVLFCIHQGLYTYRYQSYGTWNSHLVSALENNCSSELILLLIQYAHRKQSFVNLRDNSNQTPLKLAFDAGRADIALCLLAHGANIESSFQERHDEFLFLEATVNGHLSIVKLMLQAGVPINYQEAETKRSALHYAAANRHEDIVAYLKENGADTSLLDAKGRNYQQFAEKTAEKDHKISVKELIKVFTEQGSLEETPEQCVSYLLKINDPVDEHSNTLLHLAVKNGLNHPHTVQIILTLIEYGGDLLLKNKEGFTAIDYGIEHVVHLIGKDDSNRHEIQRCRAQLEEIQRKAKIDRRELIQKKIDEAYALKTEMNRQRLLMLKEDPDAVRELVIDHITHEELEFLRQYVNLAVLRINYSPSVNIEAVLNLASIHCTNLEELEINTDYKPIFLENLLNRCNKLTRLRLCFHGDLSHNLKIFKILNQCKQKFESITLINVPKGCSDQLIEFITAQSQVLHINLSLGKVPDAVIDCIASNCKTLISFTALECYSITEKAVMGLVKECPKLQNLHLKGKEETFSEELLKLIGIHCKDLVELAISPTLYSEETNKRTHTHHPVKRGRNRNQPVSEENWLKALGKNCWVYPLVENCKNFRRFCIWSNSNWENGNTGPIPLDLYYLKEHGIEVRWTSDENTLMPGQYSLLNLNIRGGNFNTSPILPQ